MSEAISERELRAEANKAKFLLEHEYFQTFTRELELAAMEQAVSAPHASLREEARIEVLLVRKLRGYLQIMAESVADLQTARRQLAAHE